MKIAQLVPEVAEIDVGEFVAVFGRDLLMHTPFDPQLTALVSTFSERLLATPDVRRTPELVALGFWTRHAALERLRADFTKLSDGESVLVPRGVVLHFPPANVDTMFVYSAVLSLLTGNKNIVRLSPENHAYRRAPLLDLAPCPVGGKVPHITECLDVRDVSTRCGDDPCIVQRGGRPGHLGRR